MRWFNPKTKQFQIEGTVPEPGCIKIFEGEDQYFRAIPSRNEKYIICEKGFVTDPTKDSYVKFRNCIDKNNAIIVDIFVGDTGRFEDALMDYIKRWKEMRPQDWA